MIQYRRGLIVLSLATLGIAAWGTPIIGVAASRGTMEVNSESVRGTANIFEGAAVRTNETVGQIQLQNGVQVMLGQQTTANIYSDRVQLREGTSQIMAKSGYGVDALGFHVSAAEPAVLRVAFENANRIFVTAVNAPLRVSRDGVLVARVNAGTTYYFDRSSTDDNSTDGKSTKGTAKTAGKTAGAGSNSGGSGQAGTATKAGLSSVAKWGIAAAILGGGTAAGLGVALTGGSASK
jgi:hypothetical protein